MVPVPVPAYPNHESAHRKNIRDFGLAFYSRLAASRSRNSYFHGYLSRIVAHQVLPHSRVLDIGCGSGDMLAACRPAHGVGIDINPAALDDARSRHADLTFHELAVEELHKLSGLGEAAPFDYIILSGTLQQIYDLHTALEQIRAVCHDRTRIIFCTFSRLWQPVIRLAEMIGWKARVPDECWIPAAEVKNILAQCDFDVIKQVDGILKPMYVPLISNMANRILSPLPGLRHLCLSTVTVARMLPRTNRVAMPRSVSVIIPARNEAGNIKPLLDRIPQMAERQEIIFVEGNSTDDTWDTIQKVVADYNAPGNADAPAGAPRYFVSCCKQTGKGKGDAVRLGFSKATGDILMILDADISVPPEELPRFVNLVASGQCEFANGSRLVYPMDKQAMQFLNMIANKCFGWMFTYLLGQQLRDTLCGTKVLRKTDYERIAANRGYFGDFDPFGDFDLLFGAARLNLKITDVPVHYKERVYGSTNISRFRHGVMLLQMCNFAADRIKFI
jgi:ubiquinone/menaquinone biosynthesis C-methylase UbiE